MCAIENIDIWYMGFTFRPRNYPHFEVWGQNMLHYESSSFASVRVEEQPFRRVDIQNLVYIM